MDKTKHDLILEKKMRELLSASNQINVQELQKKQTNEIQLKMLLAQKQLALTASNQEAQKLILKKQSELYNQKMKTSSTIRYSVM